MTGFTVLELVIQRERGGWGPGDPFPSYRDETASELDWERLIGNPEPRRLWSEDPATSLPHEAG